MLWVTTYILNVHKSHHIDENLVHSVACGNSEKKVIFKAVLNFSKQNTGNAMTATENMNNINRLYVISGCIEVCQESCTSDKQTFLISIKF